MTLKFFGLYAGVALSITVLVALLVLPHTYDHRRPLERHRNRWNRSVGPEERPCHEWQAAEAAGDVDVLLLDKNGHHHPWRPSGNGVHTRRRRGVQQLADAAQLASLADETPEGRSIVVLAKKYGLRGRTMADMPHAVFIPFKAKLA